MIQGGFDPQRDGEPYPLLLVRPAGINAYYAALSAMESWRSEFGYELIGDDWPLVFPKPDPQLARTVNQAVAGARLRQQAIVAAAPSRFRSASSNPSYRVAANGTVVRDNSPSGDGASGYRSRPSSPRMGSSYSPGGAGGWQDGSAGSGPDGPGGYGNGGSGAVGGTGIASGTPTGGYGNEGSGAVGGTGIASGTPTGGYGNGGNGAVGGTGIASGTPTGGYGNGGRGAVAQASGSGNGYTGTGQGVPAGGAGQPSGSRVMAGNPSGNAAGSAAGTGGQGRPVEIPEGFVPGQPTDGPPPPRRDPPAGAGPGSPLRPGEWYPSPDRTDDQDNAEVRKKASLAKKRGRDWGLRDASEASVPVTRPIRVDCYADRLVLVPEPGNHSPRTVLLDGPAEASIDKFISAVWEHMDSWGIAGKGMYWRPVLKVRVAPGGQQRFTEISGLLEDSGLAVERKLE